MPMSREQFLAHYGVKGMRWGRRKGNSKGSNASTSTKSGPDSEDAAAAKKVKAKASAKGVDSLSNKEMQTLVTRMNLEQQYSKLNSPTPSTNKGAAFAKNLLANTAKGQANALAQQGATKATQAALKWAMSQR